MIDLFSILDRGASGLRRLCFQQTAAAVVILDVQCAADHGRTPATRLADCLKPSQEVASQCCTRRDAIEITKELLI